MEYWGGVLGWSTGVEYWGGVLGWSTEVEYWGGVLGPVPRSPISLIVDLSRNFHASLFLNMRRILYQNACIAKVKTRRTALSFLRLNSCSLQDPESRCRVSLIPDKPNRALRNPALGWSTGLE